MNSNTKNIVHISMLGLGVVMSIGFGMLMMYYPKVCFSLFMVFLLVYSAYVLATIQATRKSNKDAIDTKWEIVSFVSMFNVVFTIAMILLAVFLMVLRRRPVATSGYF